MGKLAVFSLSLSLALFGVPSLDSQFSEGDFFVCGAQAKSKSKASSASTSSSKSKKRSQSASRSKRGRKSAGSGSRSAERSVIDGYSGDYAAAPKGAAGSSSFESGFGKPLAAAAIGAGAAGAAMLDSDPCDVEAGSIAEGGDPNPEAAAAFATLETEDLYDDDDKPEIAATEGRIIRKGTLRAGEDWQSMFSGASKESRDAFLAAARRAYSGPFAPGHFYTVVRDGDGNVRRFQYEVDRSRELVVEQGKPPKATLGKADYTYTLAGVVGVVGTDIFETIHGLGEEARLGSMLAQILGSEINFLKDVHEGDSFALVVEKRYVNGSYYGYGRIVAARFVSGGREYKAFLFPDKKGNSRYFNEEGESTKRAFLQAPLAVTRVTSSFSLSRKHPVLGYSRPHQGVDYGAPTGTPVKAVCDGVVLSRGYVGQGGNQIVLSHAGDVQSYYMHLSRFAKGLKVGSCVQQGDVIGFVGATGVATGPHLDFRLKKGGNFINPAKAINPRSNPVGEKEKARFAELVKTESEFLSARRPLSAYNPDILRGE